MTKPQPQPEPGRRQLDDAPEISPAKAEACFLAGERCERSGAYARAQEAYDTVFSGQAGKVLLLP